MRKNDQTGKDNKISYGNRSNNNSAKDLWLNRLFWVAISLYAIFILLPGLFVLFGAIWPQHFNSLNALNQLKSNINSVIGITSLVVGGISILYAYHSNREMAAQSTISRNILSALKNDTQDLIKRVIEVQQGNQVLYNTVRDLKSQPLKEPKDADEK